MPDDYIPGNYDELRTWGENFITYLQANLVGLGLTLIQPITDYLLQTTDY